jgi:hypothetical protein
LTEASENVATWTKLNILDLIVEVVLHFAPTPNRSSGRGVACWRSDWRMLSNRLRDLRTRTWRDFVVGSLGEAAGP